MSFSPPLHSIYTVHDEVKDKDFELELSWVGEGKQIVVGHQADQRFPICNFTSPDGYALNGHGIFIAILFSEVYVADHI